MTAGGRPASKPQTRADVASIEAWRVKRDALAAAATAAGEQLDIFTALQPEPA